MPSEGDPFEGWPAAESAAVIEEAPADVSVEHVRGEIDVPDGYTVLEGTPLGNKRSVGVVVSRFNGGVTNLMLRSALDALDEAGVSQDGDHGHAGARRVRAAARGDGAREDPPLRVRSSRSARSCAARRRTSTTSRPSAPRACSSPGSRPGVPVAFGVLTVETVEQAEARIDKAAEAVRSALEMADLFARLRASARQ